jgi:STE24 endopeptidase
MDPPALGAWLGIRGLNDWASLPVLMFLLSLFLFVTTPIGSAFSRHLEHQADQYGLEVTHGLKWRRRHFKFWAK